MTGNNSAWGVLGTGEEIVLASPGRRLAARLIDIVIVFVGGMFGVLTVAGLLFGLTDGLDVIPFLCMIAAIVLYEVGLVATYGRTWGKAMLGIRVVHADNGALPGWGSGWKRWGLPIVCALVPFLNLVLYGSMLWAPNRQGWHDRWAKTVVVRS